MSSILFYSTRVRKNLKKSEFFLNFFFEIFWSPVSRIVPKNCKRGPLGGFEHPFLCKIEKILRVDPLETLKKFAKKVSQSRKKPAQKNLIKDGTRTHVLLLGRPQKA